MTRMRCIPGLLAGRRKKRVVADAKKASGDCPKVKPVEFIDSPAAECADKVAPCDVKVVVDDTVAAVAATKGGGGDDKALAKKGNLSSDFEFEFPAREKSDGGGAEMGVAAGASPDAVIASGKEVVVAADASPKLKRSCSNIETKRPGAHDAAEEAPARSRSYGDLGNLPGGGGGGISLETTPRGAAAHPEASPASVRTSRTADRVMLKKRSSSQVLPSRSRKLWWRLFLWSHRNLHRPSPTARPAAAACTPAGNHGGGYTSDTLEEGPAAVTAAAADRKNKKVMVDDSPPIPNQWVAFSAENSLHDRISAWVNSIDNDTFRIAEEDDDDDDHYHGDGDGDGDDDDEDGEHAMEHGDSVARPRALEVGESSGKGHGKSKRSTAADEVAQANTIVQSLNAFSSVAHISGMGLKVVPMIAPFSSLRAVNLSGNFIGSLPKGLHSLDLSRNKIANIEGLRELTKLRVLNLNYNRISRIGHGLSGCTALRELYLAGNKISDVEGLHRLLKLAVLDLGFNKVTTARALGQLVANYHSLRALNLVGNPVQANVGDDALRRVVTGLLPHLAYLNKQPVRPRGAAAADGAVSRAALEAGAGGGGRSARKRSSAAAASRRLGQRGEGSGSGSGRSRSKGRLSSSSLPTRR